MDLAAKLKDEMKSFNLPVPGDGRDGVAKSTIVLARFLALIDLTSAAWKR